MFGDWAAERTNFPREVAEASLAHVVGDKVEAAYRRGHLFPKRRRLMDAWAAYCQMPAGQMRPSADMPIGRTFSSFPPRLLRDAVVRNIIFGSTDERL
jgi:hypothetical protein